MSYNQRTHESVGAFQVSFHVVRLGIPLALPGGPKTDHPCSLPASPDTSDAGDVIQRCPPQVTQDKQRTFNHYFSHAQCSNGFWAWRSIGCLAPPLSFLSDLPVGCSWLGRLCFVSSYGQQETPPGASMLSLTGATLTPSRMVMLLRYWAL